MTTFVVSKIRPGAHSGFKAPADVREFLRSSGATTLDRAALLSPTMAKLSSLGLAARLRMLTSRDVVVFQYASTVLPQRLMAMVRRPLLVAFVHDLESLRRGERLSPVESRQLRQYDVVIVHTEAMSRLVRESVPDDTEVVVLGMFDYLLDGEPRQPSARAEAPSRLYFVGNLSRDKSAFLYSAPVLPPDLTVYGVEFHPDLAERGLTHGGVLAMNDPALPVDGFGLVWDGTSGERLEGPFGRYLRYNAPHKLSFYIAAGVPVVVPRDAGVAPMVQELGVGLCVDGLADAADAIADCSPLRWNEMCDAVLDLREKVTSGWHTRRAVAEASRRGSPA